MGQVQQTFSVQSDVTEGVTTVPASGGAKHLSSNIACPEDFGLFSLGPKSDDDPYRPVILKKGLETVVVKDATFCTAFAKFVHQLDLFNLAHNLNVPTLNHDCLRHLATFVHSASGIDGLLNFRLVSRSWNDAGVDILNKKKVGIRLHRNSPGRRMEDVWDCKLTGADRRRQGFPIRQFLEFSHGESQLKFQDIHILRIRSEIFQFFDGGGSWALNVSDLRLSGFSARDYNSMMGPILICLPNLAYLRLDVDTETYLENNLSESASESLAIRSDTSQNEESSETILKLNKLCLSISEEVRMAESVTVFQWEFLQRCPHLQDLRIDFGNMWDISSFRNPTNTRHPLAKFYLDLQTLSTKPQLASFHAQLVISSNALAFPYADFLNSFSPRKAGARLHDSIAVPFLQRIGEEANIRAFDLHLCRRVRRLPTIESVVTLINALGSENFQNLEILNLTLEFLEEAISDSPEDTRINLMRELNTLQELELCTSSAPMLGNGSSRLREATVFYQTFPIAFRNIIEYRGNQFSAPEFQCLLTELSKLEFLEKVSLAEGDILSPGQYLNNKLLFGENNSGDNSFYKGLLGLKKLRYLRIMYYSRRKIFDETSVSAGFSKMKALKHLVLTYPSSSKVALNLLDQLHGRLILEFTKQEYF